MVKAPDKRKEFAKRIIQDSLMWDFLANVRHSEKNRPGWALGRFKNYGKLTEEDREILDTLTAEDFSDILHVAFDMIRMQSEEPKP